MNKTKKIIALLLALIMVAGIAVISTSAATSSDADSNASGDQIKVHYYQPSGIPTIYYWNSLPNNIETSYPGDAMVSEGDGWYSYTFNGLTKVNMVFVTNGVQSDELTRSSTGEYWYYNKKWTPYDPLGPVPASDVDMREETIYFVMTTRFYDGDTGNNVHCWDDGTAGNPDSDPAWRGDFQGLIDKLDYIKALGFSAIWITPVVTNGGGFDYHGYHAMDLSTVDVRYESSGATYQDLINAAHAKDMKIIQDIVWNHTGNFGEANLRPMFTKEYDSIQDLASVNSLKVIKGSLLDQYYPNYDSLAGGAQFQARLDILHGIGHSDANASEAYHRELSGAGWGQPLEQYCSIEGDCRDLNTENPEVAEYITDTSLQWMNMGVDAFRLDTEKHINRWTLNSAYFPKLMQAKDNFYIFGEVCARWSEFINEGGASDSPFFYTWNETGNWTSNWGSNFSDWESNFANSKTHYSTYSIKSASSLPTSNNVYLNGNEYHTPDYSQGNGTGVIDFTMHWNYYTASGAWRTAISEDPYFNDSSWNVVYVDSHDYSPNDCQKVRYNGGTDAWAENLALMFTFRGIPCLYYGSEVEFKKGATIDPGVATLSETGRAYFGDHIEGTVNATDFGEYTASGAVADTLNYPLAKHVTRLNQIRRAVPALQKGQYSVEGVSGEMCFKRGYTNPETGEKSFACVAVTNGATFTGVPNGTYIDAVTGTTKKVSNGTLSVEASGKGNLRCYVLSDSGYTGIDGKIGTDGTYLK